MLTKGAQTLPQKDAQLFKQLAKFHDSKNYKKGLKHAQKLLQTHPDHPETLSLKALFELGLGQENKALQTSKVALMKSKMKSMFCWHTMGTIYKHKRDYLESSKCFQNAYKFEPQNLQLLKDIAAMQIQIRDHSSHVQTRLAILKLKPNLIHHWTGFTLANHLKGDYDEMFKSLKSLDTLMLSADLKPIELSHFHIYRAVACRDAKKYDLMYDTLHKNKDKIKDEVLWHEMAMQSAIKLGKVQQAKQYMDFLMKKFPENIEYIHQYSQLHSVSTLPQLYTRISKQYSSKISKIFYVSVLNEEKQFKHQFTELIKPYYQKNLVSLFAQIQVIYESDSVKREWIEQVLESFNKSLKQTSKYPDGTESLSPSQHLWSMYILAQHYGMNFQTLEKAHQFICDAIKHTNTVSEFYIVKGQIEYKQHKNIESLKTINQARKTDLADRYMNNICVKYLFKCHKPNTAEQVMKLFMRDQANAYELQNHWYIIQAGKAFLKQRNLDAGLRHLNFVLKQFGDMQSNQFDFHYYCIRKWTLREYTELVAFNDNIFADKKFIQAAAYAIRYLREYSYYLAAQQSKKQAEEKADNLAGKKKNKKKKNKQNQVEQLPPLEAFRKKIDYYGKQYKQTVSKNPLEQALLWAKNVVNARFVNKKNLKQNKFYAKANIEAILIFIQFDKPLLVLKSFKKFLATKFDQIETKLVTLRVLAYFFRYLSKADALQISKQVINEYLSESFPNVDAKTYHQKIVSQIKSKQHFLSDIKVKQCDLIIKNQQTRDNLISLYKNSLTQLLNKHEEVDKSFQYVLYVVHQLEYYGEFTQEQKTLLNKLLEQRTSYFSNWTDAIDKLPDSTWTMWWLSEYDIARQQMQTMEQQAVKNDQKPAKK